VWRPAGLFGRDTDRATIQPSSIDTVEERTLSRTAFLIFFLITVALPFVFYPTFVMKALCFGLFACSFALLLGHLGLLSFGHAAFFGSASYLTGFLLKDAGASTEIAILAGVIGAATLGLVFGLIAIRRRGIYFAMITLALSQVIYFYALRATWTGGDNGLTNIPRGKLLGLVSLDGLVPNYAVVLALFWLGFLAFYRVIRSPFGQVIRMIRDNEPRAVSLGYNVTRYKLMAFTISAALAGLAGSTKVLVFQLASVTDLYWTMSGEVVLMTLVGGMSTVLGPVIGAATLIGMESYFAEAGSWVVVAQGVIFVFCVLALRQGVYGEILKLLRSFTGRSKHTSEISPMVVAQKQREAT